MRIIPELKDNKIPPYYIGVVNAYEDIYKNEFLQSIYTMPIILSDTRYLSDANRYIRSVLSIKKRQIIKKEEQILLKTFLLENTSKCLVYINDYLIYVTEKDYYSFFDNENDYILGIWYIR